MSVSYPGSDLYHYTHHVSGIFPEDTDETVTVAAGGTNHVSPPARAPQKLKAGKTLSEV